MGVVTHELILPLSSTELASLLCACVFFYFYELSACLGRCVNAEGHELNQRRMLGKRIYSSSVSPLLCDDFFLSFIVITRGIRYE